MKRDPTLLGPYVNAAPTSKQPIYLCVVDASPVAIRLLHEHIAAAAYSIWEKDGMLHGRDVAQWYLAIAELSRRRVRRHANLT